MPELPPAGLASGASGNSDPAITRRNCWVSFVAGTCRDMTLPPHSIHTWLALNTLSRVKPIRKTHT
jgi:hypothetical protein